MARAGGNFSAKVEYFPLRYFFSGDLLTPDGELLPLTCDHGTYFAFNVTRVLDALDTDRSGVQRFSGSGRIMRIVTHEFIPERLRSVHIFKLEQAPHLDTFVTDDFEVGALCRTDGLSVHEGLGPERPGFGCVVKQR